MSTPMLMKTQDEFVFSILLHASAPNLGGLNGDVKSYLSTLEFKNGKQFEYFHSRVLRIQQEISLSGETVSSTQDLSSIT